MKKHIYHFSNNVIKYLGLAIALFLTWYSFRFSELSDPYDDFERSITVADNIFLQLLYVTLFLLIFFIISRIEKKYFINLNKRTQKIIIYIPMAFAVLWVLILGFWWINSAIRFPEGDQAFIYDTADYFLKGEYFRLEKGGYLGKFPHQLPLVALIQMLFSVVGIANFHAFMNINVIATCLIVVASNRTVALLISDEYSCKFTATLMVNLFLALFFPLIFYTSWVYGDILSILFMLFAINSLLSYTKNHRCINLFFLPISMLFAILVRKNSEILLIAIVIVCVVELINKKDLKLLISLLITVCLPFIVVTAINMHYEKMSNMKIESGIPTSGWVYLGVLDKDWKDMYGFYTGDRDAIFYENDCDSDLADAYYRSFIKDRLAFFKNNPKEFITFFKKKQTQQWNAPLYQSLYFNSRTRSAEDSYQGLLEWIYSDGLNVIFTTVNIIQLLIYLGLLIFAIRIKQNNCIIQNTVVLLIIGGFLFTCIWEAKARYTFPYLLMMMPYSAHGYMSLVAINRVNTK